MWEAEKEQDDMKALLEAGQPTGAHDEMSFMRSTHTTADLSDAVRSRVTNWL